MIPVRDLLVPLMFTCLIFIRGCSPLPKSSWVTSTGRSSKLFFEDYDRFEDTVTTAVPQRVSTHGGTSPRCRYNPCLENQIACHDLSASTGCLCPGFTLHNEAPEAPSLRSVSWNGSEVIIQWCAPYSYVTAYTVTVGGEERGTFGMDQRSGALGDIDHIAEVCVVAHNDVGASQGSCRMYRPRDSSVPLTAGLVGGALGFLLLLLLGLLLWRHNRQRKQEASISVHDTAEL